MMLEGLPSASRIERGLSHLIAGLATPEALLVATASRRLRALGFGVPDIDVDDPQLELYIALGRAGGDDPYGTYNAWLRELSSCLEGLERRARRRDEVLRAAAFDAKDARVHELVRAIADIDGIEMVDHWDGDLRAMGFQRAGEAHRIVYVCFPHEADDEIYMELEEEGRTVRSHQTRDATSLRDSILAYLDPSR